MLGGYVDARTVELLWRPAWRVACCVERDTAQASTLEDRARVAIGRGNNLIWNLVRPETAIDALEHAQQSLVDSPWADELAAIRAHFLMFSGRMDQALAVATQVLHYQCCPLDAAAVVVATASVTLLPARRTPPR